MWTAAVLPGLRGCAVKIRDRKENGKKRGAEKGSFLFPLEGEAELLKVLTWSANEPGGEPLCPELPRFVDYFQDGKREYLSGRKVQSRRAETAERTAGVPLQKTAPTPWTAAGRKHRTAMYSESGR